MISPPVTFEEETILDKTHSYSSCSTFQRCPYSYKLTYIDFEERKSNAFAEVGSFVHHIFEMFWTKKIVNFELSGYFENYDQWVKTPFPPFPQMLDVKYFDDCKKFFELFSLDADDFDVLSVEETITTTHLYEKQFKIVVKPDVVIREKKTGKVILIDYKTSAPKINDKGSFKSKTGKFYDSKMDDYITQLYLYKRVFELEKGIKIDEIKIFFPRLNCEYIVEIDEKHEELIYKWMAKTIEKIYNTKRFKHVISPYFCMNICSVRDACKYKRKEFG